MNIVKGLAAICSEAVYLPIFTKDEQALNRTVFAHDKQQSAVAVALPQQSYTLKLICHCILT